MVKKSEKRADARETGQEDGLALLDVLIGMAIFALLAVIGVSVVNQYRARANFTTLLEDSKNLRTAAELYYADAGQYPGPSDSAASVVWQWNNGWTSAEEAQSYMRAFMGSTGVVLSAGVDYETFIRVRYAEGKQLFNVCLEHRDGGAVGFYLPSQTMDTVPAMEKARTYGAKNITCQQAEANVARLTLN